MDVARGGGVVASVGELLDDGLGLEVLEDDEEAAAAPEELEPSPAEPIVIEPNAVYSSTGFRDDGEQQCGFVWQALWVMAAPEQLVRARLFSDDAYWDCALLHVCTDEPRGVEAPAGCDELAHVSDARGLEAEDIVEVFANCLPRNPDAIWPVDLLRRVLRNRTAVGHDAPFDGLLGDSALTARAAGPPLDLEPARGELRARLAAARDRFASAAPGAAAAGALLGSAEGAPSEGKPKKRGLAEVLAERMAKFAKGPSAEATRGSSGPAAPAAASGGAAGEGAKELATALMAVLKNSAAQAAGSSGAGAASDPPSGVDGAAATGGLATKRARCRKMAQDQPGKLSELTLMQMAEFLGAVEGDAAVGPTTALVLRYLLTFYLPQNPVQQIGVAACREMRALAEAIDFPLQGKIPQALDILTQRQKAAQVAVGDGHWGAAKWLELIPAKDEPTTLRNEEEEMIRNIERGELKLEELSSRAPKGSAKDGKRPPCQRVAQLDKTAKKLPAGGSQAPLNFKAARAACPKKDGGTSKERKARLRNFMTESRSFRKGEGAARFPTCSSGSLLVHEDFPWLEAEGARGRFAAGAPPSGGQQRELASTSLLDGMRGLPAAGCAARDAEAWRDEVTVQFGTTITSVAMAVHLVQLVERHPGSLGTFSREFAERVSTLGGSGRRVSDLLPRPLPVRRWCASRDAGRRCRARPIARQVAEEAWLFLTVTALNYTYCGGCKEGWRHHPTLSQAQQQAMGFLKSRVVDLLGDPFEQVSMPAADAAPSEATVDYTGEPVAKALPCVLAELAPGLPQPEHAAALGALDFVEPDVAEWLASPEKALLPEADWPDPMPRARVNVADEAGWRELAVHLVKLGVFAVLSEDQLVRVRGEPLMNGLFAVEKKGKPGPGAERVTRLILNMVPGNALLKPHVGEASLLAASTSWVSLHIPEGKLLLWSGDDQKGAFCVWRIHKAWHPYMAVDRLRRLPPPKGAGLPPGLEWRKDEARPIVELGSGRGAGWWQVYVDDFDAPEIVDEVRARQLVGTEADCQRRVRESYRRAGVVYSAEKAHLRETRVERMGADVDVSADGWQRQGVVAVSGTSEFGGGVCASTSLRGEAASALKSVSQVLNVLIVGLFDGIGGLAASLSRLPVRIVAHVAAETDAKDLFDTFSETVDARVAGAGSPRQDLSRLDASGVRAAVLYSLLENAASMTDENVKAMSSCMGVKPYLICSSVMAPCRRPRLFWLSWQLQVAPPLRLVDKGCYLEVMADNGPLLDSEREDQGFRRAGRPLPFPTLMRCKPLPSFPSAPRGLASAPGEARARRGADWPRYRAVLYEEKNRAQDCSGRLPGRLPSCTERERLLGFDVGYTAVATKGSNPQADSDARAFLLGNSFSVYAAAWDLQRVLLAESALARPLSVPEIARVGQRRGARGQRGCFEGSSGDPNTEEARRLVLHYLSRAEKGGSDVRLDCGLPCRPRSWPRSSLGPFARRWRVVKSMAWPRETHAHINVRELQVAAAIVTKGRSSSRRLQPALRRWMVMAIAADMYPLVGYVVSEDNPADEPSRKLWYTRAVQDLLRHYGVSPQEVRVLGDEAEDADSLVASYSEAMWQSGAGIALANNTVAGVCFLLPKLRRRLDLSRALLKAWRRTEPAERVLPFTPVIVAGMAGLAAEARAFDVSCLLLISFEGLLRGGEAFALTTDDVLDRGDSVVLRIRTSKTTTGKDAAEATLVKGRWASSMTARIYIEGAVADLVRVRPADQVERLTAFSRLVSNEGVELV
ncbi:unnamed protein product [Prorocentrum cordatum]|uniref:Uncharacterized protein n=1 Tax=Prorocentrum cordatum TaxID=2364126 RepID=A0ABN9R9E6_9DINO|nr:unnamed protein product [Polarella glacialis]